MRIILIFLLLCTPALAHDPSHPELNEWLIETEMMKGQESLVSRIPLGRFGKADEVARAVIMLVDNPYMTGQTAAMSGGMAFN